MNTLANSVILNLEKCLKMLFRHTENHDCRCIVPQAFISTPIISQMKGFHMYMEKSITKDFFLVFTDSTVTKPVTTTAAQRTTVVPSGDISPQDTSTCYCDNKLWFALLALAIGAFMISVGYQCKDRARKHCNCKRARAPEVRGRAPLARPESIALEVMTASRDSLSRTRVQFHSAEEL